jgi:hypothetical protein|tara:strand:- start:3 stop:485 length:483 start_codon:yes stop_codon:yes gene_type:complete
MNIISNAGAVSAGTGAGAGGGGGSSLDSQTVTVGQSSSASGGSGAPAGTTVRRGCLIGTYGSISDGTSNLYSGASILEIKYQWDTVYAISAFSLVIAGNNRANSGWTTLTIGSTAYLRTNASYAANFGGNSHWVWPVAGDNTGASDPFSGTGTTTTCVFT